MRPPYPGAALDETPALGSAALGEGPLTALRAPFAGSDRTVVVRARAAGSGRSVVVKRYLDPEAEARHREPAGLVVMAGSGAPKVLAEHPVEPVVVLEDLGSGAHLAARLLGVDPAAGERGLLGWARALGRFHETGREWVRDFETELRRRDPSIVADYLPEHLAESAADWPALCDRLDVEPGPFEVLRDVPARWRTETRSVSPNDTCPDNCIETPSGTALLDLEHATVRHVALDAAYLVTPWPTCWCTWGLPTALAERALRAWAAAAGLTLDDDLRHDIDLAADAWRWMTTGWFLPGLFRDPGVMPREKPTPERQDRLVRSLRDAARSTALPELAATAAALADAVQARWPVGPVLDAPAFR